MSDNMKFPKFQVFLSRYLVYQGFDAEMEAAASSGDESAIIPLLPRAFEFVFSRIEEIKRDVANAHIRLIAPYLIRHGADYERSKFEVSA